MEHSILTGFYYLVADGRVVMHEGRKAREYTCPDEAKAASRQMSGRKFDLRFGDPGGNNVLLETW